MEQQIKNILKALRLNESKISTLLGVGVVLVVGALLYNYFSARPAGQQPDIELIDSQETGPEVEVGQTPDGLPTNHRVQKGEDLWAIAEKYYGSGYNWTDIAAANNLRNADEIEEGMELTIPAVGAKQQTMAQPEVQVVGQAPAEKGGKYTTVAGDSLWSVSVSQYADGYQWPKLWEANKAKIGPNPDRLETGIELSIP